MNKVNKSKLIMQNTPVMNINSPSRHDLKSLSQKHAYLSCEPKRKIHFFAPKKYWMLSKEVADVYPRTQEARLRIACRNLLLGQSTINGTFLGNVYGVTVVFCPPMGLVFES